MDHLRLTRLIREPIVTLGGAFMTSPQLSEEEARLGLPGGSLYFRGRSAVLGDPPVTVVTSLFGLFPHWLVELMLDKATPMVSASAAIEGYVHGCASWGASAFDAVATADATDASDLLYRVVDNADLTALALSAGWRAQERPTCPAERLAYALMLAREVRGGLHFAALRACGLSVPEAAVADPAGGRTRMLRTGWRPEDADALIERAESQPDLRVRRRRAEELTDETFAAMLQVLQPSEDRRLAELLANIMPVPAAP